ncbi:hypothetical protein [Thalassotalea sediminis]|uniref:hypothetical protein n=1 Tax=Thalassotalea sediminis TaxID=1759089 RepID=UPI002573FA40|nr:hypothetical protein [Thalassotalea sediminis]
MSESTIEEKMAALELKRLTLEVTDLEKPFYLKYQFLSIATPVFIALIPFLTVSVNAYFDKTKRQLEQTKQTLSAETKQLQTKNDTLKKELLSLSTLSKQYLTALNKKHTTYNQQLKNIGDSLESTVKQNEKQKLDKKEQQLITQDNLVSQRINTLSNEHLTSLTSMSQQFTDKLQEVIDAQVTISK